MAFEDDEVLPVKCHCGLPTAKRQAWTERNPGRRFVACKFYEPETNMRGCKLFRLVDKHQEDWQKVVINQLLWQKKINEGRVQTLQAEVKELEGQRSSLISEKESLKQRYKAIKGELRQHSRKGTKSGHISDSAVS